MCGIVGFTHKRLATEPAILQRAVESLVHRGPDQQGTHVSSVVSLGVVRLKVIDLKDGAQPMFSEDRDTVIVFNGEIYNHGELRAELQSRGRRFHSHCDTEVVLQAYLEWGKECFARFRGMFGVALWTESQRKLVLARDRMGIKPLYIYRRGEELYFGSEMKVLFAHPEVERNISLAGLNHYLSVNYVPGHRTLVDGIEKLPPGHLLEWHDGKLRSEKYWELTFRPDRKWNLGSAKEELDSLLHRSVREHLISDVPLAVWLSGGLDSSTILHYAAQESSSRLNTFSVSFLGRSFDESKYFRLLAERYGTYHYEFDLTPEQDAVDVVEQFATYSDEPSADAGALPLWHLSKMSRKHVVVTLSGEGADELFGGYVTYKADRMARWGSKLPGPVLDLISLGARLLPVSNEKISFEYKLKRFLEGCRLPADEAHVYWNGTFSEAEKRRLLRHGGQPGIRSLFTSLPAPSGTLGLLNRYLWFDQLYYLTDDILTKVDRISMAHSVEVRPPFLDPRIVEFAASLPENLKIRGNVLKFVLRELMRDRLPAPILKRRKEGFDIPAHEWFRGCLRSLLLDTLTESAVTASGLFHWPVLESLIRRHLDRRINAGYHLWGLLILFLWMKRWNIQTQPASEREPSFASSSVTIN